MSAMTESGLPVGYEGRHILAELNSLDEVLTPIKSSVRVKYTSVAVSKRFIAFGASTGGLYLFHRETHRYLQVLANKEGSLSHVAFGSNDNLLALATSRGVVVVWELNIEKRSKPDKLVTSKEHKESTITALHWDASNTKVFIGDDKGKVTALNVPTSKAAGFFQIPTELILNGDSRIVQLDYHNNLLLVSTLTKCYLCSSIREKFWPVGKKLRDGEFGACFGYPKDKPPIVYSARPGSRIWEADISGNVVLTHQFKPLLAIPSIPICGQSHDPELTLEDSYPVQSVNFPQLLRLSGHYLISWTNKAMYILDPTTGSVVVWTNGVQDLHQIGIYKTDIICLHHDSSVRKLTLYPVEKCIAKLTAKQLWLQSAKLCSYFERALIPSRARKYLSIMSVTEIKAHLQDNDELVEKLDEIISKLETSFDDRSSTTSSRRSSVSSCDGIIRMDSGIYQVLPENRAGELEDGMEVHLWQNSEDNVFEGQPLLEGDKLEANNRYNNVELVAHDNIQNETSHTLANLEDFQSRDIETWVGQASVLDSDSISTSRQQSVEKAEDEIASGVGMIEDTKFMSSRGNSQDMGIDATTVCETQSVSNDTNIEHEIMMPLTLQENYNKPLQDLHVDGPGQDEFERPSTSSIGHNATTSSIGHNATLGIESTKDTNRDEQTMTEIVLEHQDIISDDQNKLQTEQTVVEVKDSNMADGSSSKVIDAQETAPEMAPETSDVTVTEDDTVTSNIQHNDNVVVAVQIRTHIGGKKKKKKKKKISAPEITAQKDKFDTISLNSTSSGGRRSSVGSMNSLQEPHQVQEWSSLPPSLSQSPTESSPLSNYHGSSSLGNSPPTSDHLATKLNSGNSLPLKTNVPKTEAPNSSHLQGGDAVKTSTLNRSTSVPAEHVRYSSPSRSTSVPAATQSQSSSRSASPLPSPMASPTHSNTKSVENMVTYMGVPCYTGTSVGSPKISNFHVPSLSEVKDSISSKLSRTKDLIQRGVQHTAAGIFHDQPVDMTIPPLESFREMDGEDEYTKTKSHLNEEETSLIDFSDLIVATQAARSSLDSLTDLLDIDKVKEILVVWISHLEDAQEKVTEYLSSLPKSEQHSQIKELYKLPHEHKTYIRHLVTLCLDLEVFSSRTHAERNHEQTHNIDQVSIVTPSGHIGNADDTSERDSSVEEGVSVAISDSSVSVTMDTEAVVDFSKGKSCGESGFVQDIENEISEIDLNDGEGNYVCDEVNADFLVSADRQSAKFIEKYTYWLDFDRVLALIASCETNRSHSWVSLIEAMQKLTEDEELPSWMYEMDYNKVKLHIDNIVPLNNLLIYMDRLLKSDPDLGVEFGIDMYPKIQPWQLWYVCTQHHDGPNMFTSYVHKLLESVKRNTVLFDLCKNEWVRVQFLTSLLSQDEPNDEHLLACKCGMPRPGSYKYSWSNQNILEAMMSSRLTEKQKEELLVLSQKHCYWPAYIKLGCEMLPKTTWLQSVVQLADKELLEKILSDEANVTFTLDAWEYLIQLFEQLYQSQDTNTWTYNCLQCRCDLDHGGELDLEGEQGHSSLQPTLTWQSLAKLIMKSTSPETMLKLLGDINIPNGAFTNEFYQSCIMTSVIQHHQKNIAHSMLEKVDTYLWSKRVNVMHSCVLYHANKEMKSPGSIYPSTASTSKGYHWQPLARENFHSLQLTAEETDTHWGVLSQIDSICTVCKLSLTLSTQPIDGAVLIGKCGHVFHSRCLPERICSVCCQENG